MNWLLLAITSHLMIGLSGALDKVVLKKAVHEPLRNAFYVGLLGLVAFFLTPWGFSVPPAEMLAYSLLTGVIFIAAFIAYFRALSEGEASTVLPVVYGWLPMATLGFSYLFPGDIPHDNLNGFFLLILGTVIISIKPHAASPTRLYPVMLALAAATLFGLTDAVSKFLFTELGFVSGFLWTKVGGMAAALLMLLVPVWRQKILHGQSNTGGQKAGVLFLSNRALAGAGSVLFFYAISLGQPAIVDALRGMQLVAMFLATALMTWFLPNVLHEEFDRKHLIQKVTGTLVIIAGLFLLKQ